jgi:hypothetical protein
MRTRIRTDGEEAARLHEEAMEALLRVPVAADPLITLASFSFHGLTTSLDTVREVEEFDPILMHHVELLQAVMLRHQRRTFSLEPPSSDHLGFLRHLLLTATRTFSQKRAAEIQPETSLEEIHRRAIQEDFRLATMAVRNWGYGEQMLRTVAAVFAPLDGEVEACLGVRIGHLLAMYRVLLTNMNRRLQEHVRKLQVLLKVTTVAEGLEAFEAEFASLGEAGVHLAAADRLGLATEDIRERLISLSDNFTPDIYTFDLVQAVEAYPGPVEPSVLHAVLQSLSIGFGELSEEKPEHFFLANPVWYRPFVRLPGDRYFLPVLELLMSFCLEQVAGLVRPHEKLKKRYDSARQRFVEEEAERLLRKAFPPATIFRGVYRTEGDRRTENDVVMHLDGYLVVVEAKGGRVSDSTRRGSSEGIVRNVKDLVVTPTRQAAGLVDYLKGKPQLHALENERRMPIELDTRGVEELLPIGVTLDMLTVNASVRALHDAGMVAEIAGLAPVIPISHLEAVLEILGTPLERLHYLVRRSQFDREFRFTGDEMDVLAFYLESGLNLRGGVAENGYVQLLGRSYMLTSYFKRKSVGRKVTEPRRPITPWWRGLLRRLEENRVRGWSKAGVVLLNATIEEQEGIEAALRRGVRSAARKLKKGQLARKVFPYGLTWRENAVVALLYRGRQSRDLEALVELEAYQIREELGHWNVVVMGFDVELRDLNPSVIGTVLVPA